MDNWGVPVILTTSSNVTVIPIVEPKVKISFSSGDETVVTLGIIPSIIIALLALNEDDVPGIGRFRLALLPAISIIVPLFRYKAESLA